MHGKIYDIDGSYITVPQIKFFLNREEGRRKFLLPDDDFLKYLKVCKVYNLVSDLLEKYPEDGFFYWDEDKGCVSFAFVEGQTVATLLDELGITELDFGNGKDTPEGEDF
jgi:hypothetical protein